MTVNKGAKRRNIDDDLLPHKRMRLEEEYHQEQNGQPVDAASNQNSRFLAQATLSSLQSEEEGNSETITSSEHRPTALVDVEIYDTGTLPQVDSVDDDLESLFGESAGSPTESRQTSVTPATTLAEDQELDLEAALLQEFESQGQGWENHETGRHADTPEEEEIPRTEQPATEPIAPCTAIRKKLEDRRNPTAFGVPITQQSKRHKSNAKKEAERAISAQRAGQLDVDKSREQLHSNNTTKGASHLPKQQDDFELPAGFTEIGISRRSPQRTVAVDEQVIFEGKQHQSHNEHASNIEVAQANKGPKKIEPSDRWWQPEEEHAYQLGEPDYGRFVSRLVFKTDEDAFKSLKRLALDTRYRDIPMELGKRSRDSMEGHRGLDPKDIAEQKRKTASQKWLKWHDQLPRKERPLARKVILIEGRPDAHYTEGTQWAEKLGSTSGMRGGLKRSKLFKNCEFEYRVSAAFHETVLDNSSGVERTDKQLTAAMEQASGRFYEQVLALAQEFPQFRVQMGTVAAPTTQPIQDLVDFVKRQQGGERKESDEVAKDQRVAALGR